MRKFEKLNKRRQRRLRILTRKDLKKPKSYDPTVEEIEAFREGRRQRVLDWFKELLKETGGAVTGIIPSKIDDALWEKFEDKFLDDDED